MHAQTKTRIRVLAHVWQVGIDWQIFCAFLMNPKLTGVTVIVPLKYTYVYYKSYERNIYTVDFALSEKWFQQQQQ